MASSPAALDPGAAVVAAARHLFIAGVMSHAGDANLSARLDGLRFAALVHQELPCRAESLLRCGQAQPVPVVPWGPRGSEVSVRGIAAAIEQHPSTSAVLLADHGLLAFGADLMAAARLVVAIEDSAHAELAARAIARAIGGAVDFPPEALEQVRASTSQAA